MEMIFGDLNKKEVKKVEKIADKVDALEDWAAAFSDDELRAALDAGAITFHEGKIGGAWPRIVER